MNKILIANDKVNYYFDDKIIYDETTDLVNKIKITVLKNTRLEIIISDSDIKYEIHIKANDNVKIFIKEVKINSKCKILYKYDLKDNSNLELYKINDIIANNERNIINLDGFNANAYVVLKTIGKNIEKYDFVINHNSCNTNSDITTHGVNLNGNIYFNVTTYISKGKKNCVANQSNRIINLCNNECTIRPNLLIDEVDVIANHSALIGSFKDDEIFYLERLGFDKNTANKLLMEGFLKSKIPFSLAKYYKKYWR